jgi:HPt (histidine-containing phosphotransfer) domain-containing protein
MNEKAAMDSGLPQATDLRQEAERRLRSKNAGSVEGMADSPARGSAPVAQLAAATPSPVQVSPPATAVVFNAEEAIRRCFNREDMVRGMIQGFFEEVDALFLQMRAALEKGDLQEVGRLGHRMKGTVVYLGADLAAQAARHVERFHESGGGTPSEAEEAINALQHECIVLIAALSKHPLAQTTN